MLCPYRSRKERRVTAGAAPPPPPPLPPSPSPSPSTATTPRSSRRATALARRRRRRYPSAASLTAAVKGPALGTPRGGARHAITAVTPVTAAPLDGSLGAIGAERRRAPARPRRAVTHSDRVPRA